MKRKSFKTVVTILISTFLLLQNLTFSAYSQEYGTPEQLPQENTEEEKRTEDEIIFNSEVISADFADYGLYTPNGKDTAYLEKVEEDGRSCLKVIPNPYSTQGTEACVDGGQYHKLNVDLKEYRWITIEYKYISETPVVAPMMVGIISTGVEANILDKSCYYNATENLKTGQWTYAIVNLSDIRDHLNYDLEDHLLKKMHLYPFGYSQKLPTMSENDEIYIGKIHFSTEKPTLLKANSKSAAVVREQDEIELPGGDIIADIAQYGLYTPNGNDGAFLEKIEEDGRSCLKVVPNPYSTQTEVACVDGGQYDKLGVDLKEYNWITIEYKYISDNPVLAPMMIGILTTDVGGKPLLSKGQYYNASENLQSNKWTYAIINISNIREHLNYELEDHILKKMHIYPLSYAQKLPSMSENDEIYLGKIIFSTEKPKLLKATQGSSDNNSDEEITEKNPEDLPDYISLDFRDYSYYTPDHRDYAIIEKVEEDGKNALKVCPNPQGKDSTGKYVTIDGSYYGGEGIDVRYYQWVVLEYKYTANEPLTDQQMGIGIMANGNVGKILTESLYKRSTDIYTPNEWNLAVFDCTDASNMLAEGGLSYDIRQIHISPFGFLKKADELTADHTMYISRIMFFKNKPDFQLHKTYMKGYDDGTFLPGGNMTRAEACTVIARLLEEEDKISGVADFVDVSEDAWYYKYIGYCREKGILSSYSGEFKPNRKITRAEFAELVFKTGLTEKSEKIITFSDVSEQHPQYSSIKAASSAGLINGYPDGTFKPSATITRAEVVTVVNRALGRSKTSENLLDDITIVFVDVDDTHWAYADIAEAAIPHTELNDNWLYSAVDPIKELLKKVPLSRLIDTDAGNAKVKELDELEKTRIEEIRLTVEDVSVISGKKIYVSIYGDDANDGLSEISPVKTVAKANELAVSGDAVLLARGETRREPFVANTGITYSAYGVGDKPVIYASPENGADKSKWTLDYSDDSGVKIWKYRNEGFLDVGAIILNDGDAGFGYKEFPSYKNGQYVLRGTDIPFDYKVHLDKNHKFFHKADSVKSGDVFDVLKATGPIYFRCDEGNPGEIFDSIEFNVRSSVINVKGNNVVIDNLCLKYAGVHGIAAESKYGLTVKNCEIGWIGGSAQRYSVTNGESRIIRLGNGVELYGNADRYYVENCYIYQCYDAGVTHQCGSNSSNVLMQRIEYKNNLITDCVYSIEYFLGAASGSGNQHLGRNILIENNILRRAGFGFGSGRPDAENQRHIRSGTSANNFENFVIRNNIFDRAVFELFQGCANNAKYMPVMENNVYIQGFGNRLCAYGLGSGKIIKTTHRVLGEIRNEIGDKTGEIYFVDPISVWEYN